MLKFKHSVMPNEVQVLQQIADEIIDDPSCEGSESKAKLNACLDGEYNIQNDLNDLDRMCNHIDNSNGISGLYNEEIQKGELDDFYLQDKLEKPRTLNILQDTNEVKKEDEVIHHTQSPMTNLRNLLDKKNGNMTSIQASRTAKKLYHLDGYNKRDIAQQLLHKDEFTKLVAEKYMRFFNFSNVSIDDGLRLLLRRVALVGESQEREKVLLLFAKRYRECNPRFLDGNLDHVHVLICATALLNTDLHGVRTDGWRRMTSKQFIHNLSQVAKDGPTFPPNLLKEIYRSIKKRPLPWCDATTNPSLRKSLSVNKPAKPTFNSFIRSQSVKRFAPHGPAANEDVRKVGSGRMSKSKTIPRKQGVLWRKAIMESDGNKTVRRKRKWKLYMVALHGLEFHLAKKDTSDVSTVSLHHCLAEMEAVSLSTKRQNVFRLTLANRSTALYQANNTEETEMWVNAINRNAALLSAAPLSAGIGSELKFRRPLMPTANSTLPLLKQYKDQSTRLDSLRLELEKLEEQPTVGIPTSKKEYQKDKSEYLHYEIRKYEVYTRCLSQLLSTRIPSVHDDDEKELNKSITDTESLISASPSEPGLIVNKAPSSYQSSEDGGSYEDLLEVDRMTTLRRPRPSGAPMSSLVPTSSLPNLNAGDESFLATPTSAYQLSYLSKPSPSPSKSYDTTSAYTDSFDEANINNSNNTSISLNSVQYKCPPFPNTFEENVICYQFPSNLFKYSLLGTNEF